MGDLTLKAKQVLQDSGINPLHNINFDNCGKLYHEREGLFRGLEKSIHAITARDNLLDFTLATFDQTEFSLNWHIDLMCRKLEEFEDPKSGLNKLIVTMPPRSTKSEICTRRFPAWCIGRQPRGRPIIVGAYGSGLAKQFSRDIQGIVKGDMFRQIFPGIKINPMHKGAESWSLNDWAQEILIATGVGGPVTGKGGGILILDDPIKNAEAAMSMTIREALWSWWLTTFRTRLEPLGKILVIMTRWNEDDIVGRLRSLAKLDPQADQWYLLNLPALAEKDDEYRSIGEALHPSRYSRDDLLTLKATLGARNFGAIFQGRPTPPEGSMFKRAWFKGLLSVSQLPEKRLKVRFWDWATTPDDGDYTVGTLASVDSTLQKYIEDIVRGQWEWSKARRMIVRTAERDGIYIPIAIECVAKDATILQDLLRDLRHAGFTVYTYKPSKSKMIEAMYFEQLAQARMVTLCRSPLHNNWNADWLGEIASFPLCDHDDQVDSASGALKFLRTATKEQINSIDEALPTWMLRTSTDKDVHRKHLYKGLQLTLDESEAIAERRMLDESNELEMDITKIF